MGKAKNKHVHARVAFLYQAANYLSNASNPQSLRPSRGDQSIDHDIENLDSKRVTSRQSIQDSSTRKLPAKSDLSAIPYSAYWTSHMRTIASKSKAKPSVEIKRTLCKVCNTLLIEGQTSSTTIENKSRGGNKPWADVQVVTCLPCGAAKRFPLGATRQPKKKVRDAEAAEKAKLGFQAARKVDLDKSATSGNGSFTESPGG